MTVNTLSALGAFRQSGAGMLDNVGGGRRISQQFNRMRRFSKHVFTRADINSVTTKANENELPPPVIVEPVTTRKMAVITDPSPMWNNACGLVNQHHQSFTRQLAFNDDYRKNEMIGAVFVTSLF